MSQSRDRSRAAFLVELSIEPANRDLLFPRRILGLAEPRREPGLRELVAGGRSRPRTRDLRTGSGALQHREALDQHPQDHREQHGADSAQEPVLRAEERGHLDDE